MAYADGGPKVAQLDRLKSFLPLLDISPVDFERLHRRIREQKGFNDKEQKHYTYKGQKQRSQPQPSLLTAYRTLGLNVDASAEDIKKTYRKLMSQNHPDKLMAQGLTERALEKAKERAQEIQQAYALLKKAQKV
jgi:DnaJ like chaperone protein